MGTVNVGHLVLLAAAGVAAGAVNAIAGGGSLISFPALLGAGYNALQANVTNTVALVPGYLGGSMAYRAELEGQRRNTRVLGAISLVGGLAGSILLVRSPASVFRHLVPWLILFSCALLLAQPFLARALRAGETGHSRVPGLLYPAQFLAAVYGGYFGAGLGVMMLAILAIFLEDSLQRLNALKGLLSLIINLVSAIFFALFGPVAWLPVAVMAVASLVGGHLGVRVARHMNSTVLRAVVITFGVVVAVRLLI